LLKIIILMLDFRLDLALKMKEELKVAFKEEKKDAEKLKFHLKLTKVVITVLQENFDLSGLKDK
jgi:hypothetical protein